MILYKSVISPCPSSHRVNDGYLERFAFADLFRCSGSARRSLADLFEEQAPALFVVFFNFARHLRVHTRRSGGFRTRRAVPSQPSAHQLSGYRLPSNSKSSRV